MGNTYKIIYWVDGLKMKEDWKILPDFARFEIKEMNDLGINECLPNKEEIKQMLLSSLKSGVFKISDFSKQFGSNKSIIQTLTYDIINKWKFEGIIMETQPNVYQLV